MQVLEQGMLEFWHKLPIASVAAVFQQFHRGRYVYDDRIDARRAGFQKPSRRIASSRYCLAVPGAQYLVFVPGGGAVKVDLSTTNDSFASEWLDTDTGAVTAGPPASGGDARTFDHPGHGDAVLFLWKEARRDPGAGFPATKFLLHSVSRRPGSATRGMST